MTDNTPAIIEMPDAFVVNGVTVPKMKRSQMNLYDPAIIKAIGADLFFQLVALKDSILIPDLGFTATEWDDMENQIRHDR